MSARIIFLIPGSPAPDAQDGDCRDAAPVPARSRSSEEGFSGFGSSDPGGVLRGPPVRFPAGTWFEVFWREVVFRSRQNSTGLPKPWCDVHWLVLHLMIAGRLHWRPPQSSLAGRNNLAAFDFPNGSLILTEAGTKRRASLHLLRGEENLCSMDPGGIDVLTSDLEAFRVALGSENRTLKRALTDPRLVSGIGNAYSDEILHAAQLSPITLTQKLKPDEWKRLFAAARHTLEHWVDRLQTEAGTGFPDKVTAFHKGMAVHGRYGQPCPRCGEKVLRIR
jgi:formamidopyrimidine-DNA glycosylase